MQGRAAVLLLAALVSASADSWAKAGKTFDAWLGRKTIGILQAGDRVEVFALGPMPVGPRGYLDDNTGFSLPPGAPPTIQRYPVRRVGANQGRPFARQLARAVLDERSYDKSVIKGCAFSPGVAFRVWAQKQAVDVLLCFHCNQVGVFSVDGKEMAIHDFDSGRSGFVRLAKTALPDVAEVAKLSE